MLTLLLKYKKTKVPGVVESRPAGRYFSRALIRLPPTLRSVCLSSVPFRSVPQLEKQTTLLSAVVTVAPEPHLEASAPSLRHGQR